MSTTRYSNAGAPGSGTTIDNMASRCKAHVGFDQFAMTMFENLNVASLTDLGVGWTASNFTAVMANNLYNPFVSTFSMVGGYERAILSDGGTEARMVARTMTGSSSPTDSIWVTEAAFGLLA